MRLAVPSFQTDSINQFTLSAETVASVVGKLAFIGAVIASWMIGSAWNAHDSFEFPAPLGIADDSALNSKSPASLNEYRVISTRNIFGKDAPHEVAPSSTSEDKPLKLRLVGIYFNPGSNPFAIIEDTGKNEQDVFEVNDSVFGTSVLAKVHADKVELKKGSSIVTLELEDVESSSTSTDKISSDDDGTEFTVPEAELTDALANLPRLLSQARAVPYFRNGKSIGMRLFAIRKDSMYEKLGLKNGDIIKAVNDNSLSDPAQALKIFNQLKDERSISVVLERAGADKELSYSIE